MRGMEDKKTIFDYIGQTLQIFGFSILLLNLFCILFGAKAEGYSTMFSLGDKGLGISTMLQFLLVSVCTAALRFLFFTDTLIKNMTVFIRTVCMVISEILVIMIFIRLCGWFPADQWLPWVLFFISFTICFVVSVIVTVLKERMENKRMQEALERLKEEEEKKKYSDWEKEDK